MAENTGISWAKNTFNPWTGCQKVSPACDNCYAERLVTTRMGGQWGPGAERRRTGEKNWNLPRRWNRNAAAYIAEHGYRPTVFCASLADVFDNAVPTEWRADLFALIRETPDLLWLLLTKRPQNIVKMLPDDWGSGYPNVWLGVTMENQMEANRRAPILGRVPAAGHFFSCEPLLGQIDLSETRYDTINFLPDHFFIVGGESGPNARPTHPDWFRSLRDQCAEAGTPFHFKQWGEWLPHKPFAGGDLGGDVRAGRVRIVHPSGKSDLEVSDATGGRNTELGSKYMKRVGVKRAGFLLDGVEHRPMPGDQG